MSFLQNYTLKYTPLSPIHIGADETYEPGNYVIDDEALALYGFDSQAVLAGFDERDRQQLLAIVNGKPDDTMLTKVQAFFDGRRDKLIANANPPILTASGVADLYRKRIGKTAQHESGDKRVINKLEIERTFYNPATGQPVLPGSSIKGAIRTALLDSVCASVGAPPPARPGGPAPIGPRADLPQKNQELQKYLFEGSFHTDPLRLISLGDASWQASNDLPAQTVRFAVNRKREPVLKDGKLLPSQAEKKELYQLLECVPPIAYQSLQGSLTIHGTNSVRHDPRKLPAEKFQWTMQAIARACNRFYHERRFKQDLQILKDRGYADAEWLNGLERLFANGLLRQMDAGKAFLLRIERHSGAEAMTLDGVRNIKINQGKDKPPTWGKKPKTLWLAADTIDAKTTLQPFGWLLVEIDPQQANADCAAWLERNAECYKNWQAEQKTKLKALKQQALAKLQAEQDRLTKEQANRERLAAMSAEQLQIEALKQKLQQ